jgi:hypothetical protein
MGYSFFESGLNKLYATIIKIGQVEDVRQELQAELKLFLEALGAARVEYNSGDLEEATEILSAGVVSLQGFVSENLHDMNRTFTDAQETCVNVIDVTESIDLTGVQWAVGLTTTIIPAMVLGCLWWRVYGKNDMAPEMNRCRTWFIFPLFVLMIMISIILCSCILVGGLLNADFCSGEGNENEFITGVTGPDASVLRIMLEKGYSPRSFEFRAMAYMVSVSCFLLFDSWTMCKSQKPDSPVRTPSAGLRSVGGNCGRRGSAGKCYRHGRENLLGAY